MFARFAFGEGGPVNLKRSGWGGEACNENLQYSNIGLLYTYIDTHGIKTNTYIYIYIHTHIVYINYIHIIHICIYTI